MLAPIVAHYARKILLPHNSRIIYHFRVSHGLPVSGGCVPPLQLENAAAAAKIEPSVDPRP